MGHSVKGIILKSFGISVSCHEVSIAECQTQLVVVSLRDGFVSPGCGSVMSLTYSHSELHVRLERVPLPFLLDEWSMRPSREYHIARDIENCTEGSYKDTSHL